MLLDKLIPLFIYPLGLASVLMVVTIVLALMRSRWTFLPPSLALIILIVASNSWVNKTLIRSLEWRYLPSGKLPQAEAIILLGGTTKPAIAPRPMADITEGGDRVLYAAKLYKDGLAPLIIPSGGRLDWLGKNQPESEDMTNLLEFLGVPSRAIIPEPNSFNTYQNAVNVKKILQERGLKRVLLVTSAMHIPRALQVFKHQQIEAIPAPTDFFATQETGSRLGLPGLLLGVIPSIDRLGTTTLAIKEYLGLLVYWLRGWL